MGTALRWCAWLLLGLGLVWAREARACKPFIQGPTHLFPPVALEPEVVVGPTTVQLDCRDQGGEGLHPGRLRCRLRVTPRLENRSDRAVETVVLAALAPSLGDERSTLGLASPAGKCEWSRPSSADERERWRARVGASAGDRFEFLDVVAFELRLEPGESTELHLDGVVSTIRSINGCAMPSIHARHRLVSPDDTQAVLSVHPPAGGTEVQYEIGVEVPTGWILDRRDPPSRSADRSRRSGFGRRRYGQSLRTRDSFDVTIRRAARFVRGGPLVGLGLDLGDGVRPRLRAGWEVAAPWPFWMHGVAAESDLRSVTLVPSTQVASANTWVVFPSLGVGVGAPVRLWPRPRAGVRALISMHWPLVGVVGMLDVFPVSGGRPDLRGGVMLQVGL